MSEQLTLHALRSALLTLVCYSRNTRLEQYYAIFEGRARSDSFLCADVLQPLSGFFGVPSLCNFVLVSKHVHKELKAEHVPLLCALKQNVEMPDGHYVKPDGTRTWSASDVCADEVQAILQTRARRRSVKLDELLRPASSSLGRRYFLTFGHAVSPDLVRPAEQTPVTCMLPIDAKDGLV